MSVMPSSNGPVESHNLLNMQYMTHEWPSYRSDVEEPPRPVSGPASAESSSSSSSSYHYSMTSAPSADPYGNDTTFENSPLIHPRSPSRLSQLAGLPAEAHQLPPLHSTALFPSRFPQHTQRRQDVLPYSISASSRDPSDLTTSHGSTRPLHLESFQLPSSHPTQNVALIASSSRPRTSHPVFTSTSALAAHHGIPQSLPPVPRTTRFSSASPAVSRPAPAPPVASSSTDFDFSSLCSNYLTMLQNPEKPQSPAVASAPHNLGPDQDTVQAIMDVLQATPEFQHDFSEFLTSPMEDSPFEEFLTTPALGSADVAADLLTSPAIYDADSFPDYGSMPLFGSDGLGLSGASEMHKAHHSAPSLSHDPFNFEGMYTMPSPTTPSLDPTSLHPSPHAGTLATPSTPGRRPRKNLPTGTRKNITPDALVSMDAPIQTRKYVVPSSTSRKEVPTAFLKKKRARSQAFEEDELEDEIAIDQNDLDAIEAKRRQNTLAARRSRRRKLEYQRELELSVEREKDEKEAWKRRATVLQALLESHGHDVPSLDAL
ncbi:uncharacterized protein TRAVEDRAFT_36747 [Trametes versicolor FP-101664 SS1]|uniref:uncharacterized protein n=1 Tax=Trametes versicolor (strain FP-101664) TaxID=717944 RepID=UPI00046212D0|nr:uncharacterized protein TRAVEDRAFT_36747 [Trametes versicolor FP-101664 SS1]EIW59302.1 hypothetical protein TRAVEDRAFT_36747 [Trametes versicolor FP-101664 SS1]